MLVISRRGKISLLSFIFCCFVGGFIIGYQYFSFFIDLGDICLGKAELVSDGIVFTIQRAILAKSEEDFGYTLALEVKAENRGGCWGDMSGEERECLFLHNRLLLKQSEKEWYPQWHAPVEVAGFSLKPYLPSGPLKIGESVEGSLLFTVKERRLAFILEDNNRAERSTWVTLVPQYIGVFKILHTPGIQKYEPLFGQPVDQLRSISKVIKPTVQPASPVPTPTPDFNLRPERVEHAASGELVYLAEGEIWLIRADRSGKRQLTDDEYEKLTFSISPDGKKIAYTFYSPLDECFLIGCMTGIGAVDVETGENKILIPLENMQNSNLSWFPDSKHLSYLIGYGNAAEIYDVTTGERVFRIGEDLRFGPNDMGNREGKEVGPIVWVTERGKISYIYDGDLILADMQGEEKEILAESVDAYMNVYEGLPMALVPEWSESGRYVTYFKDYDLYLRDLINKTEVLVVEDIAYGFPFSEDERAPGAFALGFSDDEQELILVSRSERREIIKFNIPSGKSTIGYALGWTGWLSFQSQWILEYTSDRVIIRSMEGEELKSCPVENFQPVNWSGNGQAIVSYDAGYDTGTQVFSALVVDSCIQYELARHNPGPFSDGDIVWFPE